MPAPLRFVRDDLSGDATRALIAHHLTGMRASTPACSVHALDLTGLQHPAVALYSAWRGDVIAAVGAYKRIDATRAELKSMRVADAMLGTGVGRAMLQHLEREAQRDGIRSLWLETGSGPDFVAARGLYRRAGYIECEPFESYTYDPLSTFMTKTLDGSTSDQRD